MKQKPTARADRERGQQRPEEQALHAGDGAHLGAALATAQFFINTVDNGFLDFTAETRAGLGLCGVRQVVAGTEVVDAIEKVRTGNRGGPCRRAAGDGDDRARRRSRLTRAPRPRWLPLPGVLPPAAEWRGAGAWQAIDFISDLHLSEALPRTFEAWAAYLRATPADAVVILGDLFEVWVGDDAVQMDFERRCVEVLREAAQRAARRAAWSATATSWSTPALLQDMRRACAAPTRRCCAPGGSACC